MFNSSARGPRVKRKFTVRQHTEKQPTSDMTEIKRVPPKLESLVSSLLNHRTVETVLASVCQQVGISAACTQ